jgi:hypothetical protein
MLSRGGVNPQRCRHRGGRELCWKHSLHDRRPRRRSRNQRQEKWLQALGTKNQDQYWESDIAADLEADVKQEQKAEAAVTVQTPTDHLAAMRPLVQRLPKLLARFLSHPARSVLKSTLTASL